MQFKVFLIILVNFLTTKKRKIEINWSSRGLKVKKFSYIIKKLKLL